MVEIEVKIDKNNNKRYYIKGTSILHREDGPAIERSNGSKHWYQNDKLHRLDGPAYEDANGDKVWYHHGRLHREDGPAIEYADGTKYWHFNDQEVNCHSQQEFEKLLKLKSFW